MLENALIVFGVTLLGIASPGPDFFLMLKNSMSYPRKAALASALGITAAVAIHISYCVIGIGWVITQSVLLFNLLKYAGAAYLIFIGIKGLRSGKLVSKEVSAKKTTATFKRGFMEGFVCNLLNPKATLFFLSLFTQVLDPKAPILEQWVYGAIVIGMSFVYWSGMVFIVQHHFVRSFIERVQHIAEKIFGAILIGLGVKVALTD